MFRCFAQRIAANNNDGVKGGDMVLRLSQGSLIYVNLALGLFVAIANGAALMMVLTGRAARLSDQAVEIAIWSLAGVLLAASAGYALLRSDKAAEVLKLQTYLVLALVLGLSGWALMLLTGATAARAQVVWSVGYLSIVALYCAILGSHAFADPRYSLHRKLLTWVVVPVAVAIDILTYVNLVD